MDTRTTQDKLTFLYLNIGRGHPFYLDGIIEALIRRGEIGIVRNQIEVFDIARGLSKSAWRLTRWLYKTAPSNRLVGLGYQRLRDGSDYNKNGLALRMLGRDIRKHFAGETCPIIVSHPTLVGILRGHPGLIYQHGELAVPPESLVRGAELVFVPNEDQAREFMRIGYSREQVLVTGLCIEPSLVRQAQDAVVARQVRLAGNAPLTGAFFSSGAEPKPHVDAIAQEVISIVREGHRALVFAQRGGRLLQAIVKTCLEEGIDVNRIDSSTTVLSDRISVALIEHSSRREENALSARFFPEFDFFVSPAHERTNWALGLGLPMFILEPDFGTFAPLNRQVLIKYGVGKRFDECCSHLPRNKNAESILDRGNLLAMSNAGWGNLPIDGFSVIASRLTSEFRVH